MSVITPAEPDEPVYDDTAITNLFYDIPHVVKRPGHTYCHTFENGQRRVVVTILDEAEVPAVVELADQLGLEPFPTDSTTRYLFIGRTD